MLLKTENLSSLSLPTPKTIKERFPITHKISQNINLVREIAKNIILGKDKRLLVVVGPCSIHDINAALEYASLLKKTSERFSDKLCIIMRTYFEKPRTILGWRGFLTDPHLDSSHDVNAGLTLARELLLKINDIGIGTGTEFLDTIIPHYLADLISWVAIGARTSESQIHREFASGLPMAIGFKNNTDGNIQPAIHAVSVAKDSHWIFGISQDGSPIAFKTSGNPACHITLRGSNTQPNFYPNNIKKAVNSLKMFNLNPYLMIDCSHGNTGKNYQQQEQVVHSICDQINNGSTYIRGIMLESNLLGGKQTIESGQPLVYGQSITDPCLSFKETIPLLEKLARCRLG